MQLDKAIVKSSIQGVINSYGQIFFSNQYWFSILLLVVTFFDPYAGLSGLISVIVANTIAQLFGFNRASILSGLYGFNALLVGLGLGVYFNFSIALFIIIFISAVLTLFVSIMFEGVLYKYGLPFLSIPFLLVMWVLNLAVNDFTALGLSERGLYTLNMLYANGGEDLVLFYQWWNNMMNYNILTTYFISLGAIFFQYQVLAGIIIAIGLLLFSRIAFSLSLIGYFAAYFFYILIGSDISSVSYMYIGFNYILTAIAIGGFFLIPTKTSYFWSIILIPLVAVLTISFNHIFATFGLSIYALPFNIIVLLFIYILKFRNVKETNLTPVLVQEFSPEKNLYSFNNYKNRLAQWFDNFPIHLPFYGDWTIAQGHDGDYTHKEEWRHAWDFIIEQDHGTQFKNKGNQVEDYFCYGKAILACADGVVEEILDGVEDNVVGEVNLEQNWGNTLIIKHTPLLFSKISHLQKGSFKVEKGEFVRLGQELALCGNSGRSPYPHLHFQLQATPFVGSKTIEYPLASYYTKNEHKTELHTFSIPHLHEKVQGPVPERFIQNAFKWVPGKSFKWIDDTDRVWIWDVKIDYLNRTYLECQKSHDKAYFTSTDSLFYFTSYKGSSKNLLFQFYLSLQKVHMGFFENMEFEESVRPNDVYNSIQMFLQDFLAPFYMWLNPKYKILYKSEQLGFTKHHITLKTSISNRKHQRFQETEFKITEQGLQTCSIVKADKTMHLRIENVS